MARKRTQADNNNPSTVEARHKLEAERQAAAREERANIVAETVAARKATDKFISTKPTDSRNLAR